MVGPPDVAKVMPLLEDGERLRVVSRRRDVSPNNVSRLRRSCRRLPVRWGSVIVCADISLDGRTDVYVIARGDIPQQYIIMIFGSAMSGQVQALLAMHSF